MPESHQVQLQAYTKRGWAESSASSKVLREPSEQAKGDPAEHIHRGTSLEEKHPAASVQVGARHPTYLALQMRITAKKKIWSLYSKNCAADTAPNWAVAQGKGEAVFNTPDRL